jgi:predicted nucleotidyltransferase
VNPLIKLFANPTLVEILNLLFLNPEEEFYQSDLAKKVQKGLIQVQRALKILEEVGLVSSAHRGRMIYYKVVKNHPAFQDLKKLFLKTISLGNGIQEALFPFRDKISLAFIFGSVAKGDESIDSDIDLLIVTEISLRELVKALGPLSRALQRELNPVVFDSKEFKNKIIKNDRFLVEVLQNPKLWIVGDDRLL